MRLLMTVVGALAGAYVFERLKVPAGALIGAMVVVAALSLSGRPVQPLPPMGRFLAFAALGWLLGQGFTTEVLRELVRAAVPVVGTVVALLAFGGLLAWLLTAANVLDARTAFLATSPGALSQMAALSTDIGANATLVVTVHLLRVVVILLLAPLVVRLIPSG